MRQKVKEKFMTSAEVKRLLNEIAEVRSNEGRELPYELRRSLEHVNEISKIESEEAEKLVEELSSIEKVDGFIAHKIAEILPESKDEIRAVYAKERYTLDAEELDKILDIVLKYKY